MFRRCIAEMIRSGQYIPGFRWLTTAKIPRLRAEWIWRACTTPDAVKVADVETIFLELKLLRGQDRLSGPADDEEASTIPVIELDKGLDTGADLDRLCEALLEAEFVVGMKTTVKEENPMDHIP
ncbi:hypothetical protein R1flu_023980 [Riccia fluitans]|uniref:Uncharacterized protein n=1 Tax=Riccia fluitans TaxID=41844 RepID=A0ABD1XUF4_9MARC